MSENIVFEFQADYGLLTGTVRSGEIVRVQHPRISQNQGRFIMDGVNAPHAYIAEKNETLNYSMMSRVGPHHGVECRDCGHIHFGSVSFDGDGEPMCEVCGSGTATHIPSEFFYKLA